MRREVKAALAFVGLLAIALVALWLSESSEAPSETRVSPTTSPAPSAGALALAPRAAPQDPSASAQATGDPLRPAQAASPTAGSVEPTGSASFESRRSALAQPVESDEHLVGLVLGPDGSPVQTEVYAFQTGDHVSLSWSEYGDDTPTEVEAVARVLTRGQSGYLTSVKSDAAGRFRFRRGKLGDVDVVLVAVAKEGAGGLRLARGTRRADLRLAPRSSLRVRLVTTRALEGKASLALDVGEAGDLPFPALDPTGSTELLLPASLPDALRLELTQEGWARALRQVTPSEREAGLVTWRLDRGLVDLRGRVLNPAAGPWPQGRLLFTYRTPGGDSSWGEAETDAEGSFVCRGFPPGQPVELEIPGTRTHAYYQATLPGTEAPITIQLRKPSVLRIKVEGEDAGPFGLDWELRQRQGETWKSLGGHLFGRINPHFPELQTEEGRSLEHHFDLKLGTNEVLGLGPGRYRISLRAFSDRVAEPAEVVLPPGGSASCVLKPQQKLKAEFEGLVVHHAGSDLAGLEVTLTYELGSASVMHTFKLNERAGFSLNVHVPSPTQAKLAVPDLRLTVDLTLDPEAPDLGTILLAGR